MKRRPVLTLLAGLLLAGLLGGCSPEAAPDLTVVSAVQEALYNSMFGVMQGTYEPSEALDKIDEALSYSK